MSQNQEIIESKLCAFIDGELDADGRVEIEKHLEANPQHRRLLESLKATRDLIKWLPRENAPPEVAETLNGQLERSVLLDSDGDFLRPSIVPRVLAAAAIVALTAGLGLAVYYTLPKSQKNATPYAIRGGDGAPASGPDLTGGEVDRNDEASMRRDALAAVRSLKTATPEGSDVMAGTAPARQADATALEQWAAQNRTTIAALANGTSNANSPVSSPQAPAASNAVVMLVRSNAPQDARRQVTNFLDAQKIQWKEAPAPETEIEQRQYQTSQLAIDQGRGQMQQQSRTGGLQQLTTQTVGGLAVLPTTMPARADGQLQEAAGATLPATDKLPPNNGMYLARMSRQQAVSLGNSIAQEPAQSAELKDMAGSAMTFAELSAGKPAVNNIANNGVPAAAVPTPATEPAAGAAGAAETMRFAGRLYGAMARGGRMGGGAGAAGPDTRPAELPSTGGAMQGVSPPGAVAASQSSQTGAMATTLPGEEALEVVILVEPGSGPSPAETQPTTQPVAASDGPAAPATQSATSRP